MKLPKNIKRIAKNVRIKLEQIAKLEGFPPNLNYLCLRASVALQRALKQKGYNTTVVQGYANYYIGPYPNHSWLLYKKWIVDLTATQFGLRNRIRIVRANHPEYIVGKQYAFKRWPEDQQPKRTDYD